MSKMLCKCGHIISDVVYPSNTEANILKEIDYDNFFEKASSEIFELSDHDQKPSKDDIEDIFTRIFSNSVLSMSECSNCGRLWVQSQNGKNEYVSFCPDDSGYKSILG